MRNVVRVILVVVGLLCAAAPSTALAAPAHVAPTAHAAAQATSACPDPRQLPPSPFEDVTGGAHRAAITCAAWYGLTNGTSDTTFGPGRAVRRDQMASFLTRALAAADVPLPTRPPQPFTDVAASSHGDAIAQLAELGLVQGTGPDTYEPAEPVRRGQMAAFLVRLANRLDVAAPDAPDAFTDDDGTPHEAAIDEAAALGLAEGVDDDRFAPTKALRRDQMASFLARTIELFVDRAAVEPRPIPEYTSSTRPVPPAMRQRMVDVSWRPDCPVTLDDLVLLEVTHWDFAAEPRRGRLIVARGVADDLAGVFGEIYDARFQIDRMRPMHTYGGRELASLNDNNTSGFDCRAVTGGSSWSRHAFGTAIDINPRQNPYVKGSVLLPADAGPWVRRTPVRRGMIVAGDAVTSAFADIGWGWGGDFRSLKDYQHFSRSGG